MIVIAPRAEIVLPLKGALDGPILFRQQEVKREDVLVESTPH
jgi:hypothetical protein